MSLADRFGLSIQFSLPDKVHFLDCGAFGTPARGWTNTSQRSGRGAGTLGDRPQWPFTALANNISTTRKRASGVDSRSIDTGRKGDKSYVEKIICSAVGRVIDDWGLLGLWTTGDISSGVAERTFSYRQ